MSSFSNRGGVLNRRTQSQRRGSLSSHQPASDASTPSDAAANPFSSHFDLESASSSPAAHENTALLHSDSGSDSDDYFTSIIDRPDLGDGRTLREQLAESVSLIHQLSFPFRSQSINGPSEVYLGDSDDYLSDDGEESSWYDDDEVTLQEVALDEPVKEEHSVQYRKIPDWVGPLSSDDEHYGHGHHGNASHAGPHMPTNPKDIHAKKSFILLFARAQLAFGAPAHRVHSQLITLGRKLGLRIQVINFPWVITLFSRNRQTGKHDLEIVQNEDGLSMGRLRELGDIYHNVMQGSKPDIRELDELLNKEPIYGMKTQSAFAFVMTLLLCPLAFGGSVIDAVVAGFLGTLITMAQRGIGSRSRFFANIVDFVMVAVVSMVCRGLSVIRTGPNGDPLFCYTALSAATISALLPGWLILSAGLEIASKQPTSGSMRLVYGLVYAILLGIGIQVGSDLVLALAPAERLHLHNIQQTMRQHFTVNGNLSIILEDGELPSKATHNVFHGDWTFGSELPAQVGGVDAVIEDTLTGQCMRSEEGPWWASTLPWWTAFVLVPLAATVTCLQNEQPFRTRKSELTAMVCISCLAFATNHIALSYLQGRRDLVAGVSAFVIGVLGNVYAMWRKGAAYTVMLAGVLFLVPSVFGEAGGITLDGNGLTIGSDILDLTIGTTVGLFIAKGITQIRVSKARSEGHLHF